MTRLSRLDAGVYTCEAINSQGSASLNVTVDVECKKNKVFILSSIRVLVHPLHNVLDGATIKSVSENVMVDPGQDVTLSCTVQGINFNAIFYVIIIKLFY